MHNRVFIFSYRNLNEILGGGPGGVNYRLYLANKKYKMIRNTYHLFKDKIIDTDNQLIDIFIEKKESNNYLPPFFRKILKLFINKIPLLIFLKYLFHEIIRLSKIRKYIKLLSNRYKFNNNDIYIFHEIESASVFLKLFNFKNNLLVYHQQGSIYYELKSFTKVSSFFLKFFLDHILLYTFEKIVYIGFPSFGAYKALLNTSNNKKINKCLKGKKVTIFYNGFTEEKKLENIKHEPLFDIKIKEKLKDCELSFITVAALNEAKGVERIPQYLYKIKKTGKNIIWILIGDGIKAKEIEKNIKKYELKENVFWIKKRLPHSDILYLFNLTDFYILFHRFSIFDFSTIESMAYGNIPILSNVGGNKEIIIKQNGLLVENFNNIDDFLKIITIKDELKRLNRKLQKKYFSSYSFLERYSNFIEKNFMKGKNYEKDRNDTSSQRF